MRLNNFWQYTQPRLQKGSVKELCMHVPCQFEQQTHIIDLQKNNNIEVLAI